MASSNLHFVLAARRAAWIGALALAFGASPCAAQSCGWARIDHRVNLDDSGLWNPNVYRGIGGALTIAGIGGAIWEGAETRIGRTMWQGAEAEAIGALGAAAGKIIFTRKRPSETDDPCLWFQHGSNYSFPSGEAAVAAALVTPYVLEYGADQPAVYALLLLPLYVGVGRVKNQDHWQTDVLAGWALGGASGWFSHSLETPISIQLLPHGVAVGLKAKF